MQGTRSNVFADDFSFKIQRTNLSARGRRVPIANPVSFRFWTFAMESNWRKDGKRECDMEP